MLWRICDICWSTNNRIRLHELTLALYIRYLVKRWARDNGHLYSATIKIFLHHAMVCIGRISPSFILGDLSQQFNFSLFLNCKWMICEWFIMLALMLTSRHVTGAILFNWMTMFYYILLNRVSSTVLLKMFWPVPIVSAYAFDHRLRMYCF